MVMTMALALLAQTVTLEADPRAAAFTCGAAALAGAKEPGIDQVVTGSYFALLVSKDLPPEEVSSGAIDAIGTMAARSTTLRRDAKVLIAECRTRFPLAWAAGPVTLPAGDFERRMMCTAAAGTMAGIVGSQTPEGIRLVRRFGALVTDKELAARGVTSAADFGGQVGHMLAASTGLGNLRAILRGCEAAFPG